jgi:hypothetical protein
MALRRRPMANFPLRPHYKTYRGSKETIRRRVDDFNGKALRIAEHVNRLVANNPDKVQVYGFAFIAIDLGYSTDEVRSAISNGGYNGITFGVDEFDREALQRYVEPGKSHVKIARDAREKHS